MKKPHIIRCIECGRKRTVYSQNYKTVKRCVKHQYLSRQSYNSKYVKKRRAQATKIKS